MAEGRIKFGDAFARAKQNDREAVEMLFGGFLGENEHVRDCGYLGVVGYIFPDRSFWCLTDKRICALLIRRGGRVRFSAGFSRLINSMAVRQPSLILLWILIILWLLIVVAPLALIASQLQYPIDEFFWFVIGIDFSPGWVLAYVPAALALIATRFLVRIFYRLTKTGCTFWIREGIPIYLFADRQNIAETQRLVKLFTDEKDAWG